MNDRIAELESLIDSHNKVIGRHEGFIKQLEADIARLREPEWGVTYSERGDTAVVTRHGDYYMTILPSLITFIENRAVEAYKRDQEDAVGALRALVDRLYPDYRDPVVDRARATLKAIDERAK